MDNFVNSLDIQDGRLHLNRKGRNNKFEDKHISNILDILISKGDIIEVLE